MPILRRTRRDETAALPGSATGASSHRDVDAPLLARGPLESVLAKAVTIPSVRIHEHVESLRRRNPDLSPAQIITLLEKEYLNVVSATGGAVGATAAAPAVGTTVALTLTAADVAAFFTASAAFSLAVASVHGIDVQDADRRRALLLTTVLGEEGAKDLEKAIQSGSGAAATTLLTRLPTTTISSVNSTLTRRLLRRQAAKQGALAFGRLAPFGIGVWIGVKGARSLGRTVIEGAQATFGPPPAVFPKVVEVVETGGAPRLVDPDGPPGSRPV
jgi:hypothetical protein